MRHTYPTCYACKKEAKQNRSITVNTDSSVILCNDCNIKLIKKGRIEVKTDEAKVYLNVDGKKGDFLIVNQYKTVDEDYWASRKRVQDHAAMSGWDFIIDNPNQ